MAYRFLPQVQALAKSKSETIAISMPTVPQLRGKLASIDPDGAASFNAELQKFASDLVTEISQALTQSPKKES